MATAVMNVHTDQFSSQIDKHNDAPVDPDSELIEARMRDAEGRVIVHKYMKGKLLGKVTVTSTYTIALRLTHVSFYREALQNVTMEYHSRQRLVMH